jgi:prepilin-type processing-associated H-X9-DG protein
MKSSNAKSRCDARRAAAAFTLVELFVVVVVLALLAMCVLPALARAKPDARAFHCLNNHRQLVRAWRMYADDNNDRLVMNFHGGDAQGGAAGLDPLKSPWACGWLDQSTSTDNTNILFLIQDKYARLAKYFGKDKTILKCPADEYLSSVQRSRGWTARVRSISCNMGIGEGNAETGPWDGIYKHIKKTGEFIYPGPAETWVYVDEDPFSINDPGFYNPSSTGWVDQPASYHGGAAGCAFADGHVEIHKWERSLDSDIHWMSYHGGRVSDASY